MNYKKMLSPTWRRPTSIEFPQVWRKFEKTTKEGKTLKFKVQDATEDMFEEILEFMVKYYLPQEPWNSAAGIPDDPPSLEIFRDYVRSFSFPQRVTLVCTLDEDDQNIIENKKPTIVGCNLTGIADKKSEETIDSFIKSKPLENLLTIYMVMKQYCPDPHEKYKVDEFLNALGLCVHPDYRGLNISVEILKSRIPLCKAIGIKLTHTMFTATPSQITASKAGFVPDAAVKYSDLTEGSGIPFHIKYDECKLMSLVIE